jgi:hypothetical protein
VGVGAEGCGAAVAVAEAAGGGTEIDVVGEHLGGGVVAEDVEGDVDAAVSGQPLDAPGQRVRQDRVASVPRRTRTRTRPAAKLPRMLRLVPRIGAVFGEDLGGDLVERDTAALVGLGVLFSVLASSVDEAAGVQHCA